MMAETRSNLLPFHIVAEEREHAVGLPGPVATLPIGARAFHSLRVDLHSGPSERNTFTRSYLTAQGLDPSGTQPQGVMQQLMAPNADAPRQLHAKAADVRGDPLPTTLAFGGPHYGKAHQAQQHPSNSGGMSPDDVASSAIRGGLGRLFHRGAGAIETGSVAAGEPADPAAATSADAATVPQPCSGASAAEPPTQVVQVVSLTGKTAAFTSSFPAGWKLKPSKADTARRLSCPETDR